MSRRFREASVSILTGVVGRSGLSTSIFSVEPQTEEERECGMDDPEEHIGDGGGIDSSSYSS
jgi:hypothetical protein